MPDAAPPSVTKILLFTDLVDSTTWKKTLGDRDYAFALRKPHDQLFREMLAGYPGAVERDNAGDGFLATFATPSDAVKFALEFHTKLATYDWAEVVKKARLPVTRVGIHLGEVAEYADAAGMKVAGQAVDLAARVMGLATGGQTLLTRHAFDGARQHVRDDGLFWSNHGKYRFKGNEDDPLEVCEVGVGSPPKRPPADGDKAKRVLVDPADDTGSWRPAAGATIPRRDGWVLEARLGEGGFGEVWLARNPTTLQTRVFKFCFDAIRLRSFKRELTFFKLIQSELGDRPDFVKLRDIWVGKPPYFIESDYIEAGNLSQWIERNGGMAEWPMSGRLQFLADVAKAVAAAHSLGIIHKDLKPSNVFVRKEKQEFPKPLLADFGIGVLADRSFLSKIAILETGFTEPLTLGNDSSRTGTRLYSPPESQLGKPATTGTDVYALGVMLFQLVAGDLHKPLGVGWEKSIPIDDPVWAALLIEDITVATLSDPAGRMSTAAELGDRISRIDARVIVRKEIIARAERDRRELERRRRRAVLATAAVAAIVVLAVGGGVAAWGWYEENNEWKRANALAEKEKATAASEKAARQIEAEERGYAQAIADFIRDDILALTSVEGQDRFAKYERKKIDRNLTLRHVLDRAADKISIRNDLSPRAKADLHWIIGESYNSIGEHELAIQHLERCVLLRKQSLASNHKDTLYAINSLGIANLRNGNLDTAFELFEELRKIEDVPIVRESGNALTVLNNLASVHLSARQYAKAIELLEQVKKVQERILPTDHLATMITANNLAEAYRLSGDIPSAKALFEKVSIVYKAKRPGQSDTLNVLNNLGSIYSAERNYPKAIALLEQVLKMQEALLEVDHPDTLRTLNNLAASLNDYGRTCEAIKLFKRLLATPAYKQKPDHINTLTTSMNLAQAYLNIKQIDNAIPLFDAYLIAIEKKNGPQSNQYANLLAGFSFIILQERRYAQAESYLQKCLNIQKMLKPDGWSVYNTQSMLGEALFGQNKLVQAESLMVMGYQGMKEREKQNSALAKTHIPQAIDRLIRLYEKENDAEGIEKWKKERANYNELAPMPRISILTK